MLGVVKNRRQSAHYYVYIGPKNTYLKTSFFPKQLPMAASMRQNKFDCFLQIKNIKFYYTM